MAAIELKTVTLCAATSVNVSATIAALRHSLDHIAFAECLLFTDAEITESHQAIRIVPIERLDSARAYSEFILHGLVGHVRTLHCLVIQWDGFVLDPSRWEDSFLDFDYVGAPWPQFADGQAVGNGGFSLRSRKLLEACCDPDFRSVHPEDLAICRLNRQLLETRYGIKFANAATAGRFAFERIAPGKPTFGFHGIFNVSSILGIDRLWAIYRSLDDRRTAFIDYRFLLRQLKDGRQSRRRRARLMLDRLLALFRR